MSIDLFLLLGIADASQEPVGCYLTPILSFWGDPVLLMADFIDFWDRINRKNRPFLTFKLNKKLMIFF